MPKLPYPDWYYSDGLPPLGTKCKQCYGKSWARPSVVLVYYHPDREMSWLDRYVGLAGDITLCTACHPPATWRDFFDIDQEAFGLTAREMYSKKFQPKGKAA